MNPVTEGAHIQIELLRAMTVEQRLGVAQALREFAWQVKTADLRRQHPDWTDEEVLAAVRAAFQ